MPHLRRHRPWNLSLLSPYRKKEDLSHRVVSSGSDHSTSSEDWSDAIEDQKDDFYKYSESIIKEAEEMAKVNGDDLDLDDWNAPERRHSCPYTVSSGEWVIAMASDPSSPLSYPSPQALSVDDLDPMQVAMHFEGVLRIFAKVYAIAKILQMIFMGYGVELDTCQETGLMYWIHQAEAQIRTDSLTHLIEITENLFYAVYARVEFEMVAIELCSLFKMSGRPKMMQGDQFCMPDPAHVYRLFLKFKDILDYPSICEHREEYLVTRFQEGYVRVLICKDSRLGKFVAEDILGFRRYVFDIACDQTSPFCKKWLDLMPIFPEIPQETITLLAEKYCAWVPKEFPDMDIPLEELPFTNLEMLDPVCRQKDIIESHRTGTFAKLESRSIGDVRREHHSSSLLNVVKHSACICKSYCFCARECTYRVERICPCAKRQLRIQLAVNRKKTGRFNFVTRVNTVAVAGFQGLANIKPDANEDDLLLEITEILNVIGMEIKKERSASPEPSWLDFN